MQRSVAYIRMPGNLRRAYIICMHMIDVCMCSFHTDASRTTYIYTHVNAQFITASRRTLALRGVKGAAGAPLLRMLRSPGARAGGGRASEFI